jgi:hypothetical protein
MWLFNQPPREVLKRRYNFEPTKQWLEHLQQASVRFNSGGSGSFVSEDGLLISNHHVGADALQKLSTKEKNYLADGFYARTLEQEIKCLDLELNILDSIVDVTARVNEAVPANTGPEQAFEARRKVIADIQKESSEKTGLRSDVVTLWQGGAYHLYRYKRYTDVRLVFAPEQQIAFFGGDPDNFEYPRYDLDICLFRAYENGRPAKVREYLKISPKGPVDGELVFVSGHPGSTSRLVTMAELEHDRDRYLPWRLKALKSTEVLLSNWSDRNEENARRARDLLLGTENSRKALDGMLAGLLDPDLLKKKSSEAESFKARLKDRPELADALTAYGRIAEATKALDRDMVRRGLLEGGRGLRAESFSIARTLLRAAAERARPNGERLEEFTDANKASLELGLFSEQPIYEDLEILMLTHSLTLMAAELGYQDPTLKRVLAGKSPEERATTLVKATKVRNVAFRKELYEGGATAVERARDPMIELARLVDDESRALRKRAETENETKQQAHAAISRARLALLGTAGYPDATFTLRLAFGTVKGYQEAGKSIPTFTTLGGLYERSREMRNRPPFDLPPVWEKRRGKLDLKTPLNFVSTCDIIGGNSGSPVVNRSGEFVGIIFDGNLESLPWDYAFDDRTGRATSVHSAAILHALDRVYSAGELIKELADGRRAGRRESLTAGRRAGRAAAPPAP